MISTENTYKIAAAAILCPEGHPGVVSQVKLVCLNVGLLKSLKVVVSFIHQ